MGKIKQIFEEHWDQFVAEHPEMIRILLFAKLFDGSFFNLIDAEYLILQGSRQIS
jgi:hypothetical protein